MPAFCQSCWQVRVHRGWWRHARPRHHETWKPWRCCAILNTWFRHVIYIMLANKYFNIPSLFKSVACALSVLITGACKEYGVKKQSKDDPTSRTCSWRWLGDSPSRCPRHSWVFPRSAAAAHGLSLPRAERVVLCSVVVCVEEFLEPLNELEVILETTFHKALDGDVL